jgi:hypothetical protein
VAVEQIVVRTNVSVLETMMMVLVVVAAPARERCIAPKEGLSLLGVTSNLGGYSHLYSYLHLYWLEVDGDGVSGYLRGVELSVFEMGR